MTSLTHRQSDAVGALLDLYAEARQPISYRRVAERLGVGPATAYRMLRLAQAKGYVEAIYRRPPGPSAGRSPVLFAPTPLAGERLAELAGFAADAGWEATRRRVLELVETPGALPDEAELRELLAGLREPATPLARAGLTIAGLMIELEEARPRGGRGRPRGGRGRLPGDRTGALLARLAEGGSRLGLATLGGLLLGLAWAERATDRAADQADRVGRTISDRLDRRADLLVDALASLSTEQAAELARFVAQLGRLMRARDRDRRPGPGPGVTPDS